MVGYIDVHCHILPGVDDGAKNIQETADMLKIAYGEGIRHMIATPHYAAGHHYTMEQLARILEEVRMEAKRIGSDFEISLGNELYYSNGIVDELKEQKALTLAGSKYVLVEFSPMDDFRSIKEGMHKLLMGGYAPVLAHVERYACLLADMDLVEELLEAGIYIQMNISSILGSFTNKRASFCKKLLKYNMVHLLGTDAHSCYGRAPYMAEGANLIAKRYGEDRLLCLLQENPATLLMNKYI